MNFNNTHVEVIVIIACRSTTNYYSLFSLLFLDEEHHVRHTYYPIGRPGQVSGYILPSEWSSKQPVVKR